MSISPPLRFPLCTNGQQARTVCLDSTCNQHAFFCSNCDDQSCSKVHLHDTRILSIGFREFTRRVLKERQLPASLTETIEGYKKQLVLLQNAVQQFVKQEMQSLDDIVNQLLSGSPDQAQIIRRIKAEQYAGLVGQQMDKLWTDSLQFNKPRPQYDELLTDLEPKAKQLLGLREHFTSMNEALALGDQKGKNSDKPHSSNSNHSQLPPQSNIQTKNSNNVKVEPKP